jgi:DNA-binding transcriptional LysR family regulator
MARLKLSDIEAFAAVAKTRNFRRAAALRGVSASALSEAMRRLESRLKVRLLNRTARSVTLTAGGQRLFERLDPALRAITTALDGFGSEEQGGALKLSVPTAVAELVLPPIMARFLDKHPAINVEIIADNSFIDVVGAGFDAGIRYGERLERDMIAVPIGPRQQRFVTAASPHYLMKHGRPRQPEDLLDHALIQYRFASGITPAWEFAKSRTAKKILGKARMITNQAALQIAAAKAGLGIVHMFEEFLAPSIAAGTLEPILEDWTERFSGPCLYYASRHHMPYPLRCFVDFVKAEKRGQRTSGAARPMA